jgi:HK97 family phage portal protein
MKLPWPFRREVPDTEAKGLQFIPASAAYEFPFGSRSPLSGVNYAAEVRNGMYSSVVTSALCWMMRTFPEAPVVVQRSKDERWENVVPHGLTKLLRRPNPEYGGRILWMCTILDFCFGEAFWLKTRDGNEEISEVWWVPRATMTPRAVTTKRDSKTVGMLDHYLYQPGLGAETRELDPDDVVHFRFGKDPANPLRGFSPLAAVMRDVYTDDQAANFTASILRNLGIIGAVFSPKNDTIPKEDAAKLKDYIQTKFTGDNRGTAMLFTKGMDVQLMQYNLQGFDVGPIRDIAEERVCAALAIPASVIGFGTGLQQTKVGATMRESIKLAWSGGIEPLQAIMADELDRSLLPEFHANVDLFRTHFDTSQVEALTETPAEVTARVSTLFDGDIIKLSEARRDLGYPVDASMEKFKRELTPAAPPPSPGNRVAALLENGNSNGNGNGNGTQPEDAQEAV